MRGVYINLCPATKNNLKNGESDNNKILYETLLDFFTAKRYLLLE